MSPLSPVLLSSVFLAGLVKAQAATGTFPETPLASKHFKYPDEIVRGRFRLLC